MKLVIDMPDELYEKVIVSNELNKELNTDDVANVMKVLYDNSKPLKAHIIVKENNIEECSNCGNRIDTLYYYPHCPHCRFEIEGSIYE